MHMSCDSFIFLSGMGFDVHRLRSLNSPSKIILSGVPVPCEFEVIAHSDGDVVLHALTDALLGAIAEGDIGEHFPPTDSKWKDANSSQFLLHVIALCHEKKATLINIDITIICEQPKINPFKKAMKEKLVNLTDLPFSRVNIKATTTEKLGFLGRGEGIAAQAVVTVKMPEAL